MYATILSPFIEKLSEGLNSAAAGPGTLVVTHANESLLDRIHRVFAGAAVVDYPQSRWEFGSETQVRELAKLLDASGVLIIVGDSSAIADPQVFESTPVMQRAKSAESGRVAAQRNFARQVEAMIAHPRDCLPTGGWFPRVEGPVLPSRGGCFRELPPQRRDL